MLPLLAKDEQRHAQPGKRLDSKFPKYFRRLVDFRQMDFEATFDQMITLLSIEPDNV